MKKKTIEIINLSKKLIELNNKHNDDTKLFQSDTSVIIWEVLKCLKMLIRYENRVKFISFIFDKKSDLEQNIHSIMTNIWELDILKNFNKNEISQTIKQLIEEKNIEKLTEVSNQIYDLIFKLKEEEKVNLLYLESSDYIENLKIQDVVELYSSLENKSHDHCFDKIMEQQKISNNTSSINKIDFFEEYSIDENVVDKDGLANISSKTFPKILNVNPEWIYIDKYFIYYDEIYDEMKMTNYFGPDFLSFFFYLIRKHENKQIDFKIKLNFNKIISLQNYKCISLFGGTYFWPEYSERNFFTKSNQTILTRKQRLNFGFMEHFGNDITYTDFYLDQRNSSFMIEEIWENKYNTDYFINRLSHSEMDIKKQIIKHFDWSLLFYENDNIKKRKDSKLSDNPKLSLKKIKVFRIDWELEMQDYIFINLVFFSDNEMVLEYFDKKCYDSIYAHILDYEWWTDY